MGSFNNYVDRFLSFLFPLPLPGQFLYLKRGQPHTFFDVVIECPLCTVGQIPLNIFSQSTYRSIHALKLKKYLRGIQTLLCIVSIYFTYCSFKMSSPKPSGKLRRLTPSFGCTLAVRLKKWFFQESNFFVFQDRKLKLSASV